MSKLRKKKYNPNKLQQLKRHKETERLNTLYTFQAEYVLENVIHKLHALSELNGIPKGTSPLPAHIVLEAYEEQDLILAVNQNLIQTPEYWEIVAQTEYYNADIKEVFVIPFYVELPSMRFMDLIKPNPLKVHRGSSIKTRWQGLNTEIKNNNLSETIPDGFTFVRTQVRLTAHAKFIDKKTYDLYHKYLKLRSLDLLISVFKTAHI